MLNVAILMGRLTDNPELRHTTSGIAVTSFTIAVDRRVKQGEEKKADFINIVTWQKTAEFVANYFKKGQLIAVEGSIQTRKYQDKEGNNRTAFEVVANNVHFAEGKREKNTDDGGEYQALKNVYKSPVQREIMDEPFSPDDDLPF